MVTADVVVVGGGVAGLAAALAMPSQRSLIVSKGALDAGSTPLAQGGIAAALGSDDSPERHAADTIAVGGGLSDPAAVEVLTNEAEDRIASLIEVGLRFDADAGGGPGLGREAGHSKRRILHAGGDATGAAMHRVLARAVLDACNVVVLEHTTVRRVVVDGGRVVGVRASRRDGESVLAVAPAVVLATGGAGRLWSHTTNPPVSTGDGISLAAGAGAAQADLEFLQFHPTALARTNDPMPLISEAVRGEGAVLIDDRGIRFMVDEHPDAELAPRDVVARSSWRQLVSGRRVFLDATDAIGPRFPERFPTVFAACRNAGFDPRVEPVPVAPAAHYLMGGVATDLEGRSTVPGLWAVGETARTGVHGANRLASNSLLEGLVFGRRAGRSVSAAALPLPDWGDVATLRRDPDPPGEEAPEIEALLRDVMWERVGVERHETGLRIALETIDRLEEKSAPGASRTRTMLSVARMITAAALERRESRGGHYRSDHPYPDPAWNRSRRTGA
jgi:L-aspartate oxidase